MKPARSRASLLAQGDKFAIVAINTRVSKAVGTIELGPNIWASTTPIASFDKHWQDWLGSIRTEEFTRSNLFLIAKIASKTPEIIDQENRDLRQRVLRLYMGLLLAGKMVAYSRPIVLTGAVPKGEISLREFSDLMPPVAFLGLDQDEIDTAYLRRAVDFLKPLQATGRSPDQFRRFKRVLQQYIDARTKPDVLDRLHQYCRCIEGFIIPQAGNTKRTFKSRTELFIGQNHHELIGNIYDLRSAVDRL